METIVLTEPTLQKGNVGVIRKWMLTQARERKQRNATWFLSILHSTNKCVEIYFSSILRTIPSCVRRLHNNIVSLQTHKNKSDGTLPLLFANSIPIQPGCLQATVVADFRSAGDS